jgi:hypothetical protein
MKTILKILLKVVLKWLQSPTGDLIDEKGTLDLPTTDTDDLLNQYQWLPDD